MKRTIPPITDSRMTRAILDCYRRADTETCINGATWYRRAHDIAAELACDYELSVETVCGVIAVLSPSVTWSINVRDTETAILQYLGRPTVGRPVISTYRANIAKARRVLAGDFDAIQGQKVRAFYRLLCAPEDVDTVVIDGHAFNCATRAYGLSLRKVLTVTSKRYRDTAASYRRAAEILGVLPSTVQAVTWLQWRKELGINYSAERELMAKEVAA